MKVMCLRCNKTDSFEVPDFSTSDREKIIDFTNSSPIQTIKFMMDNYRLNHREAKFIVMHLNLIHNQCHRCGSALVGEYCNCKKCKALNLNWNIN